MQVLVKFEVERQTKHTYVFKEVSNSIEAEKAIGTLYVQKDTVEVLSEDGNLPKALEVTLSVPG